MHRTGWKQRSKSTMQFASLQFGAYLRQLVRRSLMTSETFSSHRKSSPGTPQHPIPERPSLKWQKWQPEDWTKAAYPALFVSTGARNLLCADELQQRRGQAFGGPFGRTRQAAALHVGCRLVSRGTGMSTCTIPITMSEVNRRDALIAWYAAIYVWA